jgi:hypothetical protein
VSGEFYHFLELLTLYGDMAMVGLCVGIVRLWASCMMRCGGVFLLCMHRIVVRVFSG